MGKWQRSKVGLTAMAAFAVLAIAVLAGCGKANQFDGTKWYQVRITSVPEVFVVTFDDKEVTEYVAQDPNYEYNNDKDITMVKKAYYDFQPLVGSVAFLDRKSYTVKDNKSATVGGIKLSIENGILYLDGEPTFYPSIEQAVEGWRATEGVITTDSWSMPSVDESASIGDAGVTNATRSGAGASVLDRYNQVLYDDGSVRCAIAGTAASYSGNLLLITVTCDRPRLIRTTFRNITNGESTRSNAEVVDWAILEADNATKFGSCKLIGLNGSDVKGKNVSGTLIVTDMISGEDLGQVDFTVGK